MTATEQRQAAEIEELRTVLRRHEAAIAELIAAVSHTAARIDTGLHDEYKVPTQERAQRAAADLRIGPGSHNPEESDGPGFLCGTAVSVAAEEHAAWMRHRN